MQEKLKLQTEWLNSVYMRNQQQRDAPAAPLRAAQLDGTLTAESTATRAAEVSRQLSRAGKSPDPGLYARVVAVVHEGKDGNEDTGNVTDSERIWTGWREPG